MLAYCFLCYLLLMVNLKNLDLLTNNCSNGIFGLEDGCHLEHEHDLRDHDF